MARIEHAISQERQKLADIIPLSTPFSLSIATGDVCNFKCNYCLQSSQDQELLNRTLVRKFITLELIDKIIEQSKEFNNKYKIITIMGIGEPLLHPQIDIIVKKLVDSGLSDRVEITTNGSLLTHELSQKLIDAGLTKLIISIQGITADIYSRTCNFNINMGNFIENINYFYNNKNKCKVHIKTVDTTVTNDNKEQFYNMFGDSCDTIDIEHIIPIFKDIDYSNVNLLNNIGRYGNIIKPQVCCQSIFYSLVIRSNGDVNPCCLYPNPINLGNIKNESLKNIWDGEIRKQFLIKHLKLQKFSIPFCNECVLPTYSGRETDYLDEYVDSIIEKM